jgi:hypothetical protein
MPACSTLPPTLLQWIGRLSFACFSYYIFLSCFSCVVGHGCYPFHVEPAACMTAIHHLHKLVIKCLQINSFIMHVSRTYAASPFILLLANKIKYSWLANKHETTNLRYDPGPVIYFVACFHFIEALHIHLMCLF